MILAFVGIDQWIKYLVRVHLTSKSFVEVIPNFIHLTHQENKGISFSMLDGLPENIRVPLLSGISFVVIVGLCVYIWRNWPDLNSREKWGFSLILSGAIGNLLDRAVRKQVTDYMIFHFFETSFFVNNLADDLISIGFMLILWQSFTKKDVKQK
ncbi:signal peptidase II [bacterium]|nr:signal peptidase II [bacterium]